MSNPPKKKKPTTQLYCAGCDEKIGPNRASKMATGIHFCPPCHDLLFQVGPLRERFKHLMGR
jgi:hypothetical protein